MNHINYINHKTSIASLTKKYENLIKGIIEGMIFVIPSTPFTTDNNLITDNININGQKSVRIYNNKTLWNNKLRIDIDISINNQDKSCKLNYYVYDLSDSNIKLFGDDQIDILDYVSYIKIIIKHKCPRIDNDEKIGTYTDCMTNISDLTIECVGLKHTLSKDIIDKLLKQKKEDKIFNDYRSMTCQDYCIHSEYVRKLI
jgi:hypothetical protein